MERLGLQSHWLSITAKVRSRKKNRERKKICLQRQNVGWNNQRDLISKSIFSVQHNFKRALCKCAQLLTYWLHVASKTFQVCKICIPMTSLYRKWIIASALCTSSCCFSQITATEIFSNARTDYLGFAVKIQVYSLATIISFATKYKQGHILNFHLTLANKQGCMHIWGLFFCFWEFYESFTDPIETNHICCRVALGTQKKCYLQKHSEKEKKKKNRFSFSTQFYTKIIPQSCAVSPSTGMPQSQYDRWWRTFLFAHQVWTLNISCLGFI